MTTAQVHRFAPLERGLRFQGRIPPVVLKAPYGVFRCFATLFEQMQVEAMGKFFGTTPTLRPGGEAEVRIAVGRLVNPETGDFVQSATEFAQQVNRRCRGLKEEWLARLKPAQPARNWSAAVRAAMGRVPTKTEKAPDGNVRRVRIDTMRSRGREFSACRPVAMLPAPAGTIIHAEVVCDVGLCGAGLSVPPCDVKTNSEGVAWVKLTAGSQLGPVRMRFTIPSIEGVPAALLPPPKDLDLLVYPNKEGGRDFLPQQPPVIGPGSAPPKLSDLIAGAAAIGDWAPYFTTVIDPFHVVIPPNVITIPNH